MRYFIVLLFLLPHFIFSQHVLLENQTSNSKSFRYVKYPNEDEKISNYFFEKISPQGALYYNSYDLTYDESLKLLIKNEKLCLNYRIQNFIFKGTASYKDISISKVLLPSDVMMNVIFYDDDKKELLSVKIDTCCLTSPLDVHEWKVFLCKDDSIKLVNASTMHIISKIYYNENDKQRFDNYIKNIEEYYSTENELKNISDVLNKVKVDNIDMTALYQIDLNKTARDLEKIENRNFFIYLDLSNNDPLDFKLKYKQLKEQHTSLSTAVNHLMSNIDEVYFNKGYSYFLKNNYEKAVEYFERSVKANPLYVRSHYRLAEVYFIKGDIDKSAEKILHIVQKLKIEKEIEENIIALAQQIMFEYVERGNNKSRLEDFHNGLKEFEKADNFCKKMPLINCHNSIYAGIENAQAGLYKSYLVIAAKAIENQRYELAAKFVYDAKTYLNNNPKLNINHKETDDIIKVLIDNLIEQGRNLYQQMAFEEALNTYNKALDLCGLCNNKSCNNLLDNEIKIVKSALYENILIIIHNHIENENLEEAENLLNEATKFQKENKVNTDVIFETENLWLSLHKIKYRNFINTGLLKVNEGNSAEALRCFLQAKTIEKNYIAFPDFNLNMYIQQAGKPILLNLLSQAKIKAWTNDLQGAKQLQDTIKDKINNYLLQDDSVITVQYNELLVRIKEQECQNFIFESEKDYTAAKRYVNNNEFVFAYDLLNSLSEKFTKYEHCNYDDKKIDILKNEIYNSYTYQNNKNLALEAYQNLKFHHADSLIEVSQYLYKTNLSVQKKLSAYDREGLIKYVYNTSALKELAVYYMGIDSLELSMKIIYLAYERKAEPDDFSLLLEVLGKRLADYDYKKNKKSTVGEALARYRTYNQWFVPFNKAYKRTWFRKKIFL